MLTSRLLLTTTNKFYFSFNYPCPRKLREVMKMSLIEKEPVHTVRNIWMEYHEPRVANTADIIEKEKYLHLANKANHNPMFILPVKRKGGHFMLLTQWQDNCFLGTYLEDYKRQGKNSQPYIVFTFFTELLFKKGITLVRSDIINSSMNKSQALLLWEQLQEVYLNEEKYNMVDQFNHRTEEFSMDRYNQMFHLAH